MPPSIIIDSLPDVVTAFDVTVLLGVGVMLGGGVAPATNGKKCRYSAHASFHLFK